MGQSKEYYDFKRKRIAEALQKEPRILNTILQERFGVTAAFINSVRDKLGIPRPKREVFHDIRKKCVTPERFCIGLKKV